jgi:hypothetical protein
MPEWVLKFVRRILGLPPGHYCIHLTIDNGGPSWTVQEIGKVERP